MSNLIQQKYIHQTLQVKDILREYKEMFLPGPLNMAFIVPDVNACSLFTINS